MTADDTRDTTVHSKLERTSRETVTSEDVSRESKVETLRFTIIIPALNEEDALAGTLTDVLRARKLIEEETAVEQVNVVLVNDGSTDRTQEIGESFSDVQTIQFEHNRGYGAAIKAGFLADDSELVGFMDADGTLQAASFVPLINKLRSEDADIVLGARLSKESKMPLVRQLGNWGFARLLGFISGLPLTDCASGMRVIKRSSLKYLMPLPNGLHFTPAMSSIALLDHRMRIVELPVSYTERTGSSKLSVLKDGLRFLGMILLFGCFYNPIKCTATAALLSLLLPLCAWLSGWYSHWLLITVLGADAVALGAALICRQAVKALIVAPLSSTLAERMLDRCMTPRVLAAVACVMLLASAALGVLMILRGSDALGGLAWIPLLTLLGAVSSGVLSVALRMMKLIRQKLEALVNDPFTHRN